MAWYDEGWVKAVLLAAGLLLFWEFYSVFFLIFTSVLLAVALASAINFTEEKTGLPRLASAFLAYIVIIGVFAGVGAVLAPSVWSQYESFVSTLPEALDDLQATMSSINVPESVVDPRTYEFFSVETATNTLSSGVSIFLDLIFIFILGVYFAGKPGSYLSFLEGVVSKEQLVGMHDNLKWWLASRLASMLTVAVLTAIGLFIIGVPFALVLALLAGLMSFIPNLGPIIAFVPAGIISAVIGTDVLLLVAILYMGVQLLETYLITPQIEKQTIDMQPGLSLTSQLVLGSIFGFMGLLLAVPLLVTVRAYYGNR